MKQPLTLTPNRRLARFLINQGRPGKIYAWNDWLLETWKMEYELINPCEPWVCLSDWQVEIIWLKFIDKPAALKQVRQAFVLVHQWLCNPQDWAGTKIETDVFLAWMDAYQTHNHTHRFLDPALLPQVLMGFWQKHPEKIPSELALIGFDEFNPLQQALLDLFSQSACDLQHEAVSKFAQPSEYLAFPDQKTQITQAVLHAASLSTDADLPIGLIIPNLQDHWAIVNRLCTEILGEGNFNISAGQPLAQIPIIYAALQCLHPQNLRYFLTTPFIQGGISQQCERARKDEELSRLETDPLPESFFRPFFGQALDEIKGYQNLSLLPSEWIEKIFALLVHWGWPGERVLNSQAYQAVTHFYRLISDCASLDQIVGSCSYSKIISLLQQRANKTMFQPESNDKPIQVLGVLEAAGLHFSHLWVMNLGSDAWPDKPSPNPFIPIHVQHKLGMPHASFARELRFAQTMMQRLLGSSPHIILSYAEQGEEAEAKILPSPLIAKIPMAFSEWEKRVHSSLAEQLFATRKIESLPEPQGLPLKLMKLKSGVRIFQDQAACPFRAYAKHRLAAREMTQPVMGLSARVKGTVLHEALEHYKKRQSSLEESINLALSHVSIPLSQVNHKLEFKRLSVLLSAWLELESQREPFQIKALEQSYVLSLEALELNCRVDRIDAVQDMICLLDYKTGEVSIKDWSYDRFENLQLPLYACLIQPPPQGIAFAQIIKGKMAWKGLGLVPLPGVEPMDEPRWETLKQTWKNLLTKLAHEYKQGLAQVTPLHPIQTCQYCEIKPFCRVNEQTCDILKS